MQYEYFVAKDFDTKQIYLVGRFANGVPELYKKGKWVFKPAITSLHQDGKLDYVSEAEAIKLIKERESQQLQVA